ncbi:mitochondrial ribonuclease P protein 1 homolog [Dermatophagoides pteronyssinus]|uniref:RNA (guanine-9-)-methyltransferase domain-containing protein 1 n=1 Tax=Dermatophagoides pteronyssinus TaxID=6956 RepID=A0A6P6Y321_DERPT|nr:mitochondrial ribonuclease P protein 1 homolog [Dermatophagoides pteronyssinus]
MSRCFWQIFKTNLNESLSFRLNSTFSNVTKLKSIKNELVYKEIDPSKYKHLINNNGTSIEMILKEYDYLKYMTGYVPSDIDTEQMSDLLSMENERQRKQYFRYLFLNEIRKQKDFRKRLERKEQYQQYLNTRDERTFGIFDENGQLSYQLWSNTLIGRISSRNVSHIRTTQRLRYASMFGQKLIIDLDYDDYMSLNECRIQVNHIVRLLGENLRTTNDPFDIYFTNCDYQKPTMKNLSRFFDTMPFQLMSLQQQFLTKSYMDVFDNERLVYLTPNATETLIDYNHNDIYIIGGFLDKSNLNKPISHMKAKLAGIRQYRLPLDQYVPWGSGSSKHLCIMHVVAILNQVKQTNNWKQTLREQIPKRKMKNFDELEQQNHERQLAYLKRKLSIDQMKIL